MEGSLGESALASVYVTNACRGAMMTTVASQRPYARAGVNASGVRVRTTMGRTGRSEVGGGCLLESVPTFQGAAGSVHGLRVTLRISAPVCRLSDTV